MPARLAILIVLVCAASASTAESNGIGRLTISVDVPEVTLTPATETGRNFIRLPSLEYSFSLRASCRGGSTPGSVSLSVADTRTAIPGAQIDEGEEALVALTVPARQIAPLPLDGFCGVATDDAGGTRSDEAGRERITVPAALSAQASVRCEDDTGEDITYVSKALDVTLVCEMPEPAPTHEID